MLKQRPCLIMQPLFSANLSWLQHQNILVLLIFYLFPISNSIGQNVGLGY